MLDVTTKAPEKATDTKHRELSWFSDRVERARKEPFTEIVTITPTIAKRLLEANADNRPMNERAVAEIAADIEHGYWVLNGETIIVSKEGHLNDGQHRLEAIVRSGCSVQSAVMWGIARAARMTIDMGRPRTGANFLTMSGVTNSNNVAAVVRTLILYERGALNVSRVGRAITKQDILAHYNQHQREINSAISLVVNDKFCRSMGSTPIAAAHVILNRANKTEAVVFFARLMDGANLKQHDAILALRNRLVGMRTDRLSATEKLETILRYWNAWRHGSKTLRSIPREGVYPKVER